jgi:hypothetical protein
MEKAKAIDNSGDDATADPNAGLKAAVFGRILKTPNAGLFGLR